MPKIYYNKKIPVDENTLALLHFDESVTKDECGNNWTTSGSPTISSDNSKFGGKSLYLNGSSYLSLPNFTLGDTDFTIDCWLYLTAYTPKSSYGLGLLPLKYGDKQGGFYIAQSGELLWQSVVAGEAPGSSIKLQLNTLYHIAVVYDKANNNINFFVNGALSGSGSHTVPKMTGTAYIGYNPYGSVYLTGYIDEFRISNVARWTADFAPPTEPYELGEKIGTRSIELSEVN